jgi:hypothetical protein
VPGPLFTEIEAIATLSGTTAVPASAGGAGSAEGAMWLAVFGDENSLGKARKATEGVRGEPPFAG